MRYSDNYTIAIVDTSSAMADGGPENHIAFLN